MEQQDREDTVGKIARLMWQDYNAGCARMYPDPVSWKVHFEQKHAKGFSVLFEWLGDAYVEFASELNAKGDAF